MNEHFRRKTPDEILQSISEIKKGRLKIILGSVRGSGKTYHLLMEGNELKGRDIDVVIGIISDGCNQMAMEQVGCLEVD